MMTDRAPSPVTLQAVPKESIAIFIIEPAMWMVAQSGTQKLAISSLTPFFFVCSSVTGMVAALDEVPKAVK